MAQGILIAVGGAIVAWLGYVAYIELRNQHHVWHAPCITPPATREDVLYVLRTFRRIAAGKGINWWIDYGTLLGAWRIAGMLPFDHDGDMGYAAEHKPLVEQCRGELAAAGIDLNIERGILFYKGERLADLEPWYVHGAVRCREGPATRDRFLKITRPLFDDVPCEWVEPTWEIEFEGDRWPCPGHPERLLRRRYPTCRIHLRLCFPHKQKCWFSGEFWRAAWAIFCSRRGPVIYRAMPESGARAASRQPVPGERPDSAGSRSR